MTQYETPHWTGPPPRPERDVWSDIAGWFARYAFFLLLVFFVCLVGAALAFLPSLRASREMPIRGGESQQQQSNGGTAPSGTADAGFTQLNVSSNPPGALVQVDVDSVGITPMYRLSLERKVHLVSIVKPGFARIDTVLFADDFSADTSSFFFVLRPSTLEDRQANLIDEAANVPVQQQPVTRDATPVPERVERRDPPRPAATIEEPEAREIRTGTLSVTSNPLGAAVSLDGRIVGATPLSISGVEAGNRTLELSLDGYSPTTTTISVRPGERSVVQSVLTAASGTLVVLPKPYGTIYIDGRLVKANMDIEFTTTLPAGSHLVSVVHPVLGQLTHTVEIGPTETSLVFDFLNMNVIDN